MNSKQIINTSRIVAVCGIDGSGKTSLISQVSQIPEFSSCIFVRKRERKNVNLIEKVFLAESKSEKEYYCGDFAKLIRWAHGLDFLEFYETEVMPHLEKNVLIISDRWDLCSIAYANTGTREGKYIAHLLKIVQVPDLLVYLDISPRIAQNRIAERGNPQQDESLEILESYHRAYENLILDIKSEFQRMNNKDQNEILALLVPKLLKFIKPI